MYAIIETGGKQYRVKEGDILLVEKLEAEQGDIITIEDVLAVSKDGKLTVGSPIVDGAKVEAKVVEQGKSKKLLFLNTNLKRIIEKTGSLSAIYKISY